MQKGKFELDYCEPNVEKEIPGWAGKTIKSARAKHTGSGCTRA